MLTQSGVPGSNCTTLLLQCACRFGAITTREDEWTQTSRTLRQSVRQKSLSHLSFNFFARVRGHQRMVSNNSGCAPTRKRTSSAGFALCTILPAFLECHRLKHVADECRAHVVLCPGTRLRSRENREYHTEQLSTSLWMEKRTVHDDLLTTNKEEGPLLHCAGTAIIGGRGEW